MNNKVIFRVSGWGELNGSFRIKIEKIIDREYAYSIRKKKLLIKFIENEYPGIKVKPNTLSYRINHITENKKKSNKNNSHNIISIIFSIVKNIISKLSK